jgi:integrase
VPNRVRWWTEQADKWSRELSGVSQKTRRDYATKVSAMARRFEARGTLAAPKELGSQAVEDMCRDSGLYPTTRNGYMLRLRKFLKWAGNPISDDEPLWRAPRWVATHRDWAELAEMSAILCLTRNDSARVAIALGATCGLRDPEIIGARVEMVRPEGSGKWALVFRGKFDKPRRVPLHGPALDALLPTLNGAGPQARLYPYSRTRLWRDIAEACVAAGIRHLRPHDLRRGFAREFLRANGSSFESVDALREILGHEDIAQTLYYAGLGAQRATDGMDAFARTFAGVPPIRA